jgi:hypothetical protein
VPVGGRVTPCRMLTVMTNTHYVIGWHIDSITSPHMQGVGTAERRTAHAVPAAAAGSAECPTHAECGEWVHEVSDRLFSATPSLAAMRPCPRCAERVAGW